MLTETKRNKRICDSIEDIFAMTAFQNFMEVKVKVVQFSFLRMIRNLYLKQ